MTYSPLTIRRRNILGDIYGQCDRIDSIPVYLESTTADPIGSVDESLGRYTDAFVFRLPEDVCKKLSTGSYEIGLDFDSRKNRIKLNHIILLPKQLPIAIPRRNANSLSKKASKDLMPES